MYEISLPQNPRYTKIDAQSGTFEILGCYPGYGTTLGNAIRRVLLSSLGGAAITSVKIRGVSHEFSTVDGVLEDVVQIILHLKKVRFRMHSDEPVMVTLSAKKEGKVTAGDIKTSSDVEVINPDQVIATITDKKAMLEMEMEVTRGLGYVPVEQQKRDEKEIGAIAVDAVYTPIRRVNYDVENMRVGKQTDYEKVTLEIVTDGSLLPQEAFAKAVEILVDQFSALKGLTEGDLNQKEEYIADAQNSSVGVDAAGASDPKRISLGQLKGLSTRTVNALTSGAYDTVGKISALTEEELKEVDGMGEKGIKEVKKALGEFGITLRQSA